MNELNLSKKNNKNEAYEVIKTLVTNGFEAYLAGGCVRDELLGIKPNDYDVATNATPDQIEKIFYNTVSFAKKYGVTLVVFKDKKTVETTTFRKDFGYQDGRRPDYVVFGKLEEDYIRRDFTINALYKDILNDKVIDFSGGIEDLKNKIIRCVGIAEDRFREDKLRILRAIRFAGALDYKIADETKAAMTKYLTQFSTVSAERINDELTKMLTKKNAARCLKLLDEIKLLKIVLPEFAACKGVEQPPEFHPEGDVFIHTIRMFEFAEFPISKILAYSILFHDIGKPAVYTFTDRIRFNGHDKISGELTEKIMLRLRFSRKEIGAVKYIVENHMKFGCVKEMRKSTLQKLLANKWFDIELELHRLDCISSHGKLDCYDFLIEKKKEFDELVKLPQPFITGRDLINAGLKPGPIFKKIIADIYNLQLENKIADKQKALTIMNDLINEQIKDWSNF